MWKLGCQPGRGVRVYCEEWRTPSLCPDQSFDVNPNFSNSYEKFVRTLSFRIRMGETNDGEVIYLSSDEEEVQDPSIEVVDLSSDEEVQEDVSLVLLKRPPVMESHDATIDLDSDDEFPVCVGKWELLDVSQTCL